MTARRRSAATLEDLLARYRATRDPAVLGAAFDRAAPGLFRLALAWTPDAAGAEDALQETFLAAFEGIDGWDARRPAAPWLAGILRHQAARARRRARRRPEPLAGLPPSLAAGPASVAEAREDARRVRDAIARLAEPYRSVALLRWRHGLSPADIAEVRGEPPGTVRSTLTRALARLRRDLRGLAALAFLPRRADDAVARGLAGVRRDTLRELTRGAATVTAAALVLGGIAMATKKQIALAASAAALLSAGWLGRTCGEDRPPEASAPPRVHVAAAPRVPAAIVVPDADSAPSPAPLPAGDEVRGRVVARSGDPVAGARVSAFRESVEQATDAASERSVTTDADGRFAVAGLTGPPPYVVAAAAAGFAPRTRIGVRPPGDVTIVLGEPAAFEGRVLGPGDAPVAGARVRVCGVLAGGAKFDAACTSAADGAYRVDGLPPVERRHRSPLGSVAVECRADGFAPLLVADVLDVGPQALPDLAEARTARLDLHVVRGAVVAGRTVDESGRPAEGVRVALMSYERPLALDRFADAPRHLGTATSAADGTFRFDHVPAAGVHRPAILGEILPFGAVVAVAPDGRTGAVLVPVLRDGETHAIEVALARVAWVAGRVVDGSGAPVAGAAVSLRSTDGRPPAATFRSIAGTEVPCPFATSGADGRFRAAVPLALDAGTRLEVAAATPAAGMEPRRTGEVVVEADPSGTTDAGDVVLRAETAGVHADVAVVDEAGRPVAGASFRERNELHIPGSAWGWPATDAAGLSRLSWRPRTKGDEPEGPALREVVVTAPGFAAAVADVPFDAAVHGPQRISLAPGRHVAGRVRRPDGRPAADAWVLVADGAVPLEDAIPSAGSRRAPPDAHPAARGLVLLGRAHAEADGSFRVDDLPDRAFHVVARVEAPAGPGGGLVEVARAAASGVGPDADDVGLVLPPRSASEARPAATLDVRVLDDATGGPLEGARAELVDGTTVLYGTVVGEGRVRFDAVPPGTWTLRAAARRHGETIVRYEARADAPAQPLDVRVARGAAVRGRIDGVTGTASVYLVRTDAAVPWFLQSCAITSADGTFSIEGVAPGRYDVVVADGVPAESRAAADVLVIRAGDTDVRFESRVATRQAGR